jgi:hypothetical protein
MMHRDSLGFDGRFASYHNTHGGCPLKEEG